MIKIEFNDTTIRVPQSFADISFGDYEQFCRMPNESPEEQIRYVAAVCGTTYETLMQLPTEVFESIVAYLGFINKEEAVPSPVTSIDGVNYYVSYGDKLTLGEWIDVDTVLAEDNPNYLSDTLAILSRPAGEAYDSDKNEERALLFRRQSCEKMLPLITFFLHRKNVFDEISNRYSGAVALGEQFVRDTDRFVRNGDGIKRLPIWQRIKYTFLMRSLRKQLSKFSASSSIR